MQTIVSDKTTKVLMAAIAILLVANLFRTADVVPSVQAQNNTVTEVIALNGFAVGGLKDALSLGDGKTFVVTTPDKFMVYQVRTR